MSDDNKKITEDKIAELRKRSESGFLQNIINEVTPIKATVKKKTTTENIEDMIASIFDE